MSIEQHATTILLFVESDVKCEASNNISSQVSRNTEAIYSKMLETARDCHLAVASIMPRE